MLPRADLNPTRPLASLEAATTVVSSTDARLEVFTRLNQIAIGRELQATVDAMLDNGTYLVKVADTTARMALPVGTKVGDTMSMVFIAKDPRPTFLLTQQQGSTPASLSTTARLIDHLLHAAEQEGAPSAVTTRIPLVPSPAAMEPKQVASALQNALSASGLFYESHLHEWISGTRPAAELAREPQAQLSGSLKPAQTTPAQDANSVDLGRLAANMREIGDGAHKLMNLIREAQLQPANTAAIDADLIAPTQSALPTVEPEAARMINLQLNALEHQAIRWQGQLWPGMPMEWEVQEEHEHGGRSQGNTEPSTWMSTVRFELPHLGGVAATIRLVGDRVHVQVNTQTEDTATTVRAFGGMLADALDAAGTPLDSLSVKQHESP
ncbi:flagellar hook-length control protein FliK [Noviherbaspirillum sp. ST9]|uniref:flagellar hook-length control protein FliK n=1 Tax=Noviherbaspirillum sp. ST9 TaxID=3401606 RepID=UPI003B586CD2